jgi:hypothetical protein
MSRNEEYQALLSELEQTPKALETTMETALNRKKALHRKRRAWGIPAGSLAACFAAFILLVNLFPPFAQACSNIPVLQDLARAVSWSRSLSAAVENEYVQSIGQSQTVNGITATMEYVIVDQKQVNIFFTLDGDYDNLSAELPQFAPEQMCSVIGADYRDPPGTLLHFTLDYQDHDVPGSLTVTFGVTTWVEAQEREEASVRDYEDELLDPTEEEQPDILAAFTFTLSFDPQFTAKGEVIPVNRTVDIDGQSITVTEVEVYPTHVRVNVSDDPANTAWLKELDFYLENEGGEQFQPISNGVSGTGSADSPMMTSFYLESPYFVRSQHLTLQITGATWLDKDMERVRLDLVNRTAEALPEGVTFTCAERREGGWVLEFQVRQRREHLVHQVWEMVFYDAAGNRYESTRGSSLTGDGFFTELMPLPNYTAEEVWLVPSYSRTVSLPEPITIPIK